MGNVRCDLFGGDVLAMMDMYGVFKRVQNADQLIRDAAVEVQSHGQDTEIENELETLIIVTAGKVTDLSLQLFEIVRRQRTGEI